MEKVKFNEEIEKRTKEIADKWQKEMSKGYTKVVTLALLAIKEMHGYQLVEKIKEKTYHFLNPNPSTIYPILKSLEEKGFIEGRIEEIGKRGRKVYTITQRGRNILCEIINRQQKIQKYLRSLFKKLKGDFFNDIELGKLSDELFIFDIKKIQNDIPKSVIIQKLEFIKGIILSRINKLKDRLIELDETITNLKISK
ncbi:MAG: PadR family transcriptional regulator [Candidatus Helarchaeota archaeon]